MSLISTQFSRTASALALATAALAAPFNSMAQTVNDHPLLKLPGVVYSPLLEQKAMAVVRNAMQEQVVPVELHSTYGFRASDTTLGYEFSLNQQLAADPRVIGQEQRTKREKMAVTHFAGKCDPTNSETMAKDRMCSELDISIAAILPKIGPNGNLTPIPVCIAQGMYPRQLVNGKIMQQVIYTGYILPTGQLQDESTTVRHDMVDTDLGNGKTRKACADFILSKRDALNNAAP